MTIDTPLRVIFVTQDEPFYLPIYLEQTLLQLPDSIEVAAVIALSANLPGKNFLQTLKYYMEYFGLAVFTYMAILRLRYWFATLIASWRHHGSLHSIKSVCQRYNISYLSPQSINQTETLEEIRRLKPHIVFSLACPQIFRHGILGIPSLGCLNIHSSLLPKLRGINANFWAMQQGETKSGVTIHYMNEGIDDGAIVAQKEILIAPDMSLHDLYMTVIGVGSRLISDALIAVREGAVQSIASHETASSYFSFPEKADVKIFRQRKKRFFRYL